MAFRPAAHKGGWICLGLGLGFSLVGGWFVWSSSGRPLSAALFWGGFCALVSFGLAIYFFYRAFALFCLTYVVDRNGLQICCGGLTRRVPMAAITAFVPAGLVALWPKQFWRFKLPNWWIGTYHGVGFYNTAPLQRSLAAQTQQGTIVISPAEPQAFLKAWQLRLPLGPTQTWTSAAARWPFFDLPFWFDPLAWRLAGGAILLCLILVGATMTAYPTWPPSIPISFNTLGRASVVASREQVLWLPMFGVAVLALNLVLGAIWHQKERLAAYLLWFVALLAQIGVWVAIRAVVG